MKLNSITKPKKRMSAHQKEMAASRKKYEEELDKQRAEYEKKHGETYHYGNTKVVRLPTSESVEENVMLDEMAVIPLDADLETVASMLDAAKRGLGFANKLSDPIQRKRHVRAVFINLNKIRAALAKFLEIDNETV